MLLLPLASSCLFLVSAAAATAPPAPPAPQTAREARMALFERRGGELPGVVPLRLAPGAHAELARLHARGETLEDARWPLPGGAEARARLFPVSAFEPGARAQVVEEDGSVSWLAPSVACFAGTLEGGGEVFVGVTADGAEGYFRFGGALHFLSSAGAAPGEVTLAHAAAVPGLGAPDFCAVGGLPRALPAEPSGGAERLGGGPSVATANVFIEADRAYRQLFPSNQACVDYSALLLAAASTVYRRDLGVRLAIPNGYLRVWNTTAPWGVITGFNDISDVRDYWVSLANPDRGLPRAAVHVLTSPVFGGVAYSIGGVCINGNGYEISSVFGHFPSPIVHTHNDNWDLFVVTHEFGHTFGCIHSFDFQPPIQCTDGSGPDMGTIMSYCHLSFGTGAVGMRFHVREQREIRTDLTFVTCLANQPIARGDYDADGVLGASDLLAAEAVLAQGFRSLGAEETLDMDADDDFDAVDRDLLAAQVGAPPASVAFRNGNGSNPACLSALGNPVLGHPWTLRVSAGPAGRLTGILIYDLPHAGIPTPFGQLLVRPPGQGGRQLFTATASSGGVHASYSLSLPLDVALVGLASTVQGIVIGPPGTQLCNALDVVLSTYE
jgi:hypothetical protein